MKKMNAFIAALALALAAATPLASFADDQGIITPATATEKSILLSQTHASNYTLTLPADTPNLEAESPTIMVGMNAFLEYNQNLKVTVVSKNGWQLVDTKEGSKAVVGYTLKNGETDITEEGKNTIIDIIDNVNKEKTEVTLKFTHFDEAACAGTYEDQLTFKVTLDEISQEERTERLSPKVTTTEETTTTTTTEATTEGTTTTPTAAPVE